MEDLDSVLRRVAKLLAIAQDDRANANEAAVAAGQAERIMRKYQIDHADVILQQLKSTDNMDEEWVCASAKTNGTKVKIVPSWASILGLAVGRLNDCHVTITRPNGDAGVSFRGFSADVKVAAWMFSYLVSTSLRLCNEYKKTLEYDDLGRSSINSFRSGVTSGIADSINRLRRDKEHENQVSTTGTSLVIAKAQLIQQAYGAQRFVNKKCNVAQADSFTSGYIAGKQVNVGSRAVTNNSPQTLRLT